MLQFLTLVALFASAMSPEFIWREVESGHPCEAVGDDVLVSSPVVYVGLEPEWPRTNPLVEVGGVCAVMFDIASGGEVSRVQSVECTDSRFEQNTRSAVERSIFLPANADQVPVEWCGAEQTFTFVFSD